MMGSGVRWFAIATVLAAAFCLAGVFGCGGGSDGGTRPPPGDPGTDIGPTGGVAASPDGRATVTVPAGALDRTVTVTVAPAAAPPAGVLPGTAYDLGPGGTLFAVPVTLAFTYDPAVVPSGTAAASLRLARAAGALWIPLADSAVDSVAHLLTGTVSHFSTFGATAGGGGGGGSRTAYLLDNPSPGAVDQFSTLAAALAWLGQQLGYEDEGVIVWQTDTAQQAAALAFLFDLRIEVQAGRTPIIQAAGAGPLTIDAGGAVDLSGFTFQASGGLVLNANRFLALSGCTLPDQTTLNIGGVKRSPFPAGDPGHVSKSVAAAARAKGAAVTANQFGAGATVAFVGAPAGGDYDISDNSGQNLHVTGPAGVAGTAIVTVSNPIPYPNISLPLRDSAQLKILRNRAIASANVQSTVAGRPLVQVEGNEGGTLHGIISGTGGVQLMLTSHKIMQTVLRLDVPEVIVEGQGIDAERLEATVSGGSLTWSQAGGNLSGGLQLDAGAVSGDVSVASDNDVYGDDTTLTVPPGASATVNITGATMNGTRLLIGGGGKRIARADARRAAALRGGVALDGLAWSGEGTDHIEIFGLDVPVTINGCTLSNPGSVGVILGLTDVGGAINITDTQLSGGGIGLVDCAGTATIDGATIAVTGGAGYGISLGGCAGATIMNTDISCLGGVIGFQAANMSGTVTITQCSIDAASAMTGFLFAFSTVNLDSNPLLSGQITIIASQVHMSGNTFSSAQVIDDWTSPGLQNDPVADNDGLSPDDVFTRMDWDGNGCCDYPPELNQVDEHGNCVCDGVGGKNRLEK